MAVANWKRGHKTAYDESNEVIAGMTKTTGNKYGHSIKSLTFFLLGNQKTD